MRNNVPSTPYKPHVTHGLSLAHYQYYFNLIFHVQPSPMGILGFRNREINSVAARSGGGNKSITQVNLLKMSVQMSQ